MPAAKDTLLISATPQEIFDVVVDYQRYPEFLSEIKRAEILERPEENVVVCRFTASIIKEVQYTLRLVHTPYEQTRWTFLEGDLFQQNKGGWDFEPQDDGRTLTTYQLEVELRIPVPGLITRKLVGSNIPAMLKKVSKRTAALKKS